MPRCPLPHRGGPAQLATLFRPALHVLTDPDHNADHDLPPEIVAAQRADERNLRLSIGGFSVVLLITIMMSVQLSTAELSFGSLVYGSPVLWRGHDAGFRVTTLDPILVRPVGWVAAEVVLRDSTGERARGRAEGKSIAEVQLLVPEVLEAEALIDVSVSTEKGDDAMTFPVRSVKETGGFGARLTSHREALMEKERDQQPKGPLQIALYPETGHAVAGLPNTVTGYITNAGKPFASPLKLRDQAFRSDAHGLFEVLVPQQLERKALPFEVGDAPSQRVDVPLDFRTTQLKLQVQPRPFVRPGEVLKIRVDCLPFRGPVHIDVWAGDALLLATSDIAIQGAIELEVTLPQVVHGFVRIEAYRNLLAPEGGTSTAILWASAAPPPENIAQAMTAVARLDGESQVLPLALGAVDGVRARLASMVMSRIEPIAVGMPMLRSSMDRREEQVKSRRDSLRARLHRLFAATVILGFALTMGLAVRHQLRTHVALRGVVDEGIAAGEDVEHERASRWSRINHAVQTVSVFLALLLAIYSIWVLLNHIAWKY